MVPGVQSVSGRGVSPQEGSCTVDEANFTRRLSLRASIALRLMVVRVGRYPDLKV